MSASSSVDGDVSPADAIGGADLRVLLMCLVHLTGDTRWIEPPFTPERDVRLIADADAGFTDDRKQEIRAAALELIEEDTEVACPRPDDRLLHRMMNACLGEDVASEYLPMMVEDMGFEPRDVQWTVSDPAIRPHDRAVVVGAGVSGLCIAAKLARLGLEVVIIEKNPDVGGTWYENTYPGCGVDTPNHFYSYSFHPNTGWRHFFALRDEVQDYIKDFAAHEHLLAKTRFDTEVIGATWDESRQLWTVRLRTRSGTEEQIDTRFLISAIGQLNRPSTPALDGEQQFRGQVFHSARWPADLDVTGRDVALVGTGASAMQIVPTIAPHVRRLTIYQRSPQWARPLPEYHRECPPGHAWLLKNLPFYAEWFRFSLFWRYGDGLHRFLQRDPNWPHPERSINRRNDRHREELTAHITERLASRPDLIEHCVPSYPPWGKRMLIDNGWFDTLLRDNVELVTEEIDQLVHDGIRTEDDQHRPADTIVLATGFSVTDLTARLDIQGRHGTLAQAWAEDNPTAYLGITVPTFPNLFILYGPNTNVAHGGSIIFQAECQSRYITSCIVQMLETGATSIDCRQDVHADHIAEIDAAHENMVWTHPGMDTWYRNQKGRVISPTPWRFVDYWSMTHDADLEDYHVVHMSGPDGRPGG